MDAEPPAGPLNLLQALLHWCDPDRLAAVKAEERRYLVSHVHQFYAGQPRLQLSKDAELRKPTTDSWLEQPSMAGLFTAWDALERDLRLRLERGEFHLTGVQSEPERTTARQPVPGVWAADMRFQFGANAVQVGESRFIAIEANQGPEPPPTISTPLGEAAAPAIPALITPDSVRTLTDEEVLLLLEEHARRVIDSPDGKLLSPGKLSMMPLIAGKLRRRAKLGELLPTQAEEVQWLYEWVKSKVDLHYVPTVATIKRVLGKQYSALKVRSNGEIRKV